MVLIISFYLFIYVLVGPFKDYPQVTVYHPNPGDGHAFANIGWTGWFGSITGELSYLFSYLLRRAFIPPKLQHICKSFVCNAAMGASLQIKGTKTTLFLSYERNQMDLVPCLAKIYGGPISVLKITIRLSR